MEIFFGQIYIISDPSPGNTEAITFFREQLPASRVAQQNWTLLEQLMDALLGTRISLMAYKLLQKTMTYLHKYLRNCFFMDGPMHVFVFALHPNAQVSVDKCMYAMP